MSRALGCFLLWLAASKAAAATNGFELAPAPAWVVHRDPVHAFAQTNDNINEGEMFLLVDQQVHAGTREYYGHFARQLVTDTGVQNNGKLQFSFEPTYEKLLLHFIRIVRGTSRIDQLRSEKINVIQQEKELDWNIYNGRVSAVLFLEDLRVGDIIDYAYTIRGANPIWGNHFADAYTMSWSRPVVAGGLRLLWPTQRKLFIRKFLTDLNPTQSARGDLTEYVWVLKDVPAVLEDDNTPIWFDPFGFVQFSDFATWAEVVSWVSKMYAVPETLPAALEQEISRWREQQPIEAQIQSVLRFLQDEIRYLGISIGPHSHKPETPATVFARRFGDCKDKALLFCAILRQLGISASPALVHTSRRHTIAQWHPTPFAFDHVIVRVKANGKTYWLDPTRSHQRGPLHEMFLPDYGRALVLAPDERDLTHIPFPGPGLPRQSVHESYTVSDYKKPADLRVTTVFEGAEADRMRSTLSDTRREELEKNYRDFYARTFPEIKVRQPLQVHDNASSNHVEIVEHYEIPDFWSLSEDKRQFYCEFEPHSITEFIEAPGSASRTSPFAVPYPRHRAHIIEVHLPENWPVEEDTQTVQSSAVRLRFQTQSEGRTVRLGYDFETLADSVAAGRIQEHIKAVNRANEFTTYMIYRSNPAWVGGLSQLNWPIAFGSVMYVLLAAAGAFLFYRRFALRPADAPPPLPSTFSLQPQLQGIGGWLILVALGVVLSPFQILHIMYQNLPGYGLDQWQALTTPGSESYHALWAPVLILELIMNLTLLVASILIVILFFKKKRAFPKAFIAFMALGVAVLLLDHIAVYAIPAARAEIDAKSYREVIRAALGLALWASYMLVSKRVKATFIN